MIGNQQGSSNRPLDPARHVPPLLAAADALGHHIEIGTAGPTWSVQPSGPVRPGYRQELREHLVQLADMRTAQVEVVDTSPMLQTHGLSSGERLAAQVAEKSVNCLYHSMILWHCSTPVNRVTDAP
jgi:hypothetical protein